MEGKCKSSLAVADQPLRSYITNLQADSQSNENVGENGFADYFKNSADNQCPITSCELLSQGCQSPYSSSGNIKVGEQKPW